MGHEASPPKVQETPLMDGEMKSRVVDLSPFFLFEAVGDSEGDFDHQSMMMKMMMVGRLGDVHNHDNEDYDDDDEDAESCSHDVWVHDTSHANGIGGHGSTHVVVNHDNQHHYDDDIDGCKVTRSSRESSWGCHDGDDGNGSHRKMAQSSRFDHDHDHNKNKSTSEVMSTANSHASRNSSCEGKKMSEQERSRLFWETCLAS